MDIFCDVITEEMSGIQLAEQLPKIAAVTTPESIRDWTVTSHQEIAPCIYRILLAAAQTSVAKEKNKKKFPDTVCYLPPEKLSFVELFEIALQCFGKAAELPALDSLPRLS
jgi:hypothetical protein